MRFAREATGDFGESSAGRVAGDRTQATWGGGKEEGLYLVSRVGMKKNSSQDFPHITNQM